MATEADTIWWHAEIEQVAMGTNPQKARIAHPAFCTRRKNGPLCSRQFLWRFTLRLSPSSHFTTQAQSRPEPSRACAHFHKSIEENTSHLIQHWKFTSQNDLYFIIASTYLHITLYKILKSRKNKAKIQESSE